MGNIQNDLSQLSDEEFNRISEQFDAQPKPYLDQVKEGVSGLISGNQSMPDVPWFLKHAQPAISGAKNLGLGIQESASNQLRGLGHVMGQEAPTQSPLDKMIRSRLQAMGVPAPQAREPQQPFVSVQTGSGPAYESGKFIAEAIPNLLSKNPISGIAGSSIQAMALDPNNYQEAAKSGAGWGAFGEALPVAAKGLGKAVTGVADKFTRNEYSQKIMKNLAEHYNSAKKEAMSHLSPLLKEYGKNELTSSAQKEISNSLKQAKAHVGPDIRNVYHEFKVNPNLENAQKLQSEIGDKMRAITSNGESDQLAREYLKDVRDSVIGSMKTVFGGAKSAASKKYDKFREVYAKDVAPYMNNFTLNKISQEKTSSITPQDFEKSLRELTEGTKPTVQAGHFIHEVAPGVTRKMKRSDLYAFPGAKKVSEKIQNDELARVLQGIGSLYPWARSGVLGQLNAQQIKPFDLENNRGGE